MAKSGKKTIIYDIKNLDILEEVIEFAKKKGENSGLRVHIEYTHNTGLVISIAGPKDKINLFDHLLRDFVAEMSEEFEN